ncbi:MAG: MerR family transcriptional regulator [Ignavibacteriales bacterium]|nr:MAG: MerR family transcriptional regulator [Ignavibacteriales bacterium]
MKDLSIKKLYYSISEVSKLADLEQYILRYWETEFEELKPSKNRAGNRIYTNKDIQTIMKIKKLLRDEKYTIEGAKKIIKDKTEEDGEQTQLFPEPAITKEIKKSPESSNNNFQNELVEIRNFLLDIFNKI